MSPEYGPTRRKKLRDNLDLQNDPEVSIDEIEHCVSKSQLKI